MGLLKRELMRREGWTRKAIEEFAPPYYLESNPVNGRYRRLGVYRLRDIERIERTREFLEHLAAYRARKEVRERFIAEDTPEKKAEREEKKRHREERRLIRGIELAMGAPVEVRHEDPDEILDAAGPEYRRKWRLAPVPCSDEQRRRMWYDAVIDHMLRQDSNFCEHDWDRGPFKKGEPRRILLTRYCMELDRVFPEFELTENDALRDAMSRLGATVPKKGEAWDF